MPMDSVHKFLKIQNRPYSVNDIVSNLHNEYGKAAVQKALDQLVIAGKVFEKVYGKQKVYCIVQDSKYDAEELTRINSELLAHANEVENKLRDLEKEIREREAVLAAFKSSVTIEEAKAEKALLEKSVNLLTHKLDELMEGSTSEDLTELKRKAEVEANEYSREYAKRKRMCTEILDCILENYPGSKSTLYEEVGIEAKIVK